MINKRGNMARLTISLNGRPYSVACEEGQEARLLELAAHVDDRVQNAAALAPNSSDAQQLALAALLLADEVFDLQRELADLRSGDSGAVSASAAAATPSSHQANSQMAVAVDQLAKRIEDIAAKLERA